MVEIKIVPQKEFSRIWGSSLPRNERLSLVANMCRANALTTVKKAGSGHLGSTFSSLDIVTMLYYSEMNTRSVGITNPDRDIYFSSKGHDVPGHYSVLYSLGILPEEQFLLLRRIEGTCGHPDINTPCIEANSGSLGMGISKAKGMAFAKRYLNHKGRIIVMTGDGELQEGQNYEALQNAVQQKITNITVIVDHNKIQTDKPVSDICDLGDLQDKFRAFGWYVARCDGHNFDELEKVFRSFDSINDKPKILIADTIKGKGVSFMEHPRALIEGRGFYQWHSGAPDDASFEKGYQEIIDKLNKGLRKSGIDELLLKEIPPEQKPPGSTSDEYVADAYGESLLEIAKTRKDLIVLDADLASDCRIRKFESQYPEQFIENGIAEQDMVSMAGGLALQGLLPVVNSFAAFLASRANEQIYNNNCESSKIIYTCHYAGVIPAGPGQSHQSVRDISLLGALPSIEILQPCNAAETRMVVNYCVNEAENSCMIRLIIGPSPRIIQLPCEYNLTKGKGITIKDGSDAVLFTYGPVMLHEALVAAEILDKRKFSLKVVNIPWLNIIDPSWLKQIMNGLSFVIVLEDHSPFGGVSDTILRTALKHNLMEEKRFDVFGIEGSPAWGRPWEALRHHGVDGESIAARIITKKF